MDIIAAIDKDQDLELSYKELLAAVSPATVGCERVAVATTLTVGRCWEQVGVEEAPEVYEEAKKAAAQHRQSKNQPLMLSA